MKTTYYIIVSLFALQLSAQDPILQTNDEILESVATNITAIYDDKLSLDAKQFILFQKKVEEYLIKEEKIENKFEGEAKLDMLYKLRKAESMEVRNILTQPQFEMYMRIKSQIQPLANIQEKN